MSREGAPLLEQQTHRRLNIVIDVQDSFGEMDALDRKEFMKSFRAQIANLDEASKKKYRAGLKKSIAEEKANPETRLAYRRAIRDAVAALRARGVPTLYMTMGDSSELHPCTEPWSSKAPAVRDQAELGDLQLKGLSPRRDEGIFRKRFMSGFADVAEVAASPELEKYVVSQRHDGAGYKDAHFGRPTLLQHLKALGVESVSIMGGNAEYCITDNALDAAKNGFSVTVLPDLVLPDRQTTWDASPGHAATQMEKIANKLGEAVSDPSSRGYKISDAGALKEAAYRIEFRHSTDFIASLNITSEPGRPKDGVAQTYKPAATPV